MNFQGFCQVNEKSRLVSVTSYMRGRSWFPQIQLRLVNKKYPDKIEEIKADAKWNEIEHMLGLDHGRPAVQAMGFLTFILKEIFCLLPR